MLANKLQILIVDDELPARQELHYLLTNYFKDKIQSISEAKHGWDAIEKIKQSNPNVIFLDINMPGLNGLEVARIALKTHPDLAVIFVTAFDDYALKAFEVKAMDYLVKPIDLKRLETTINRLLIEKVKIKPQRIHEMINYEKISLTQQKINKVPCEEGGRIVLIKPEEIYYCTLEDGKSLIVTKNGRIKTFYTLNQLEEKLGFFRTHRSYLVNVEYIKIIEPLFHGCYQLILDDEKRTTIPVSRIQSRKLKEILDI